MSQPSTRSWSTRANPERSLNWLFHNLVNDPSTVHTISVPGYPQDILIRDLEWVAALKECFNFRAKKTSIKFWQPSTDLRAVGVDENWINDHPTLKEVARYCQPIVPVVEYLGKSWNSLHVQFIITAEGVVDEADSEEAIEVGDSVSELPLQIMERRLRKAKEAKIPAPSTAARSKEHVKLQDKPETATYDGSFVTGGPLVPIAPPIQIFHPVFQEFLDRINNLDFEPDEEVVREVSKLMPRSPQIFPSENAALVELRKLLTKLLGGYMGQAVSRKSRVPDGIIFKQTASCNIPLVLLEYKRAIGEGGCDPFLQAAYSLREFLFKDELSGLLDKCGCPSFLLAGGGTRLSILGAIHTDKFIVQQLADVYIGEATTHEDTRAFHVAKVFTSLRDARATLDKYYEGILRQETSSTSPQQGPPTPRRCFFPYPTKFREYGVGTGAEAQVTEFEYTDVPDADPANVTFFVRVKSSGRKLVVKFVDRYGVEAHEHMAKVGMAPRLLYCGSLDGENDVRHGKSCVQGEVKHGLYVGPLRMAVMEYIKPEERPGDAREKTREVIDELHGRGFVFGDLREPNVLFSGGKVYLIDFDWAGKIGEARYPRGLSSRVDWPGEAESLERELIEADHDFIMLSRLFPE